MALRIVIQHIYLQLTHSIIQCIFVEHVHIPATVSCMLHEATKVFFFLIKCMQEGKKKKKRVTDVEAPWIIRRKVDLGIKIFFLFWLQCMACRDLKSSLTRDHTCAPCIRSSVS